MMRSRLPLDRELEIIEIADLVGQTHSPGEFVCPKKILAAEQLKYSVGAYGLKTFDGMIEFRNDRFFIYCNSDRGNHPDQPRGRFTLGHELGHFYIPEHNQALRNGAPRHQSKCGLFDGQQVTEELEADLFAAHLLMPPSRFDQAMRKVAGLSPLRAILALKDIFRTSILATAIRYAPHCPEIVALMKWNDDALAWKRIQSEYFLRYQYRRWKLDFPLKLPKESATRLALDEAPAAEKFEVFESVSTASFCFHEVCSTGDRNLIFREEALRLGHHGALTLLSLHPKFPSPKITWN